MHCSSDHLKKKQYLNICGSLYDHKCNGISCCITCEPQSEHTFKLYFYFTGLMEPTSDGQSQRGREQQTEGPPLNVPPLSLSSTDTDQKGTQFSSWWRNPSRTALFLLLLLTEKVKYSSILKKTHAANNNNTSLWIDFLTHSLYLQCWL
jgi:hypothetical protein